MIRADEIAHEIENAGLGSVPERVASQLELYLQLLLKWNAKLNLSAIRDPQQIVHRHFLESIACARAIPEGTATLLDYGSGAGFPGVPCALLRPEIQVTLAESQTKKASFLRETARALAIDVEVYHGRVEDLPAERRFSAVTLRAVDNMLEACRVAQNRVVAGGWLVVMSTQSTADALRRALQNLRWEAPIHLLRSDQEILLLGQTQPS